jgi:hypothetical protein
MTDGGRTIVVLCYVLSATSAAAILLVGLFYAIEVRSAGPQVLGSLSDIIGIGWLLLLLPFRV